MSFLLEWQKRFSTTLDTKFEVVRISKFLKRIELIAIVHLVMFGFFFIARIEDVGVEILGAFCWTLAAVIIVRTVSPHLGKRLYLKHTGCFHTKGEIKLYKVQIAGFQRQTELMESLIPDGCMVPDVKTMKVHLSMALLVLAYRVHLHEFVVLPETDRIHAELKDKLTDLETLCRIFFPKFCFSDIKHLIFEILPGFPDGVSLEEIWESKISRG